MATADQLERYSSSHLLKRYARGRLAHFWNRQVMTLLGVIVLAVVNGPASGAIAAVIALTGEAVDCRVLSGILHRLDRGGRFDRLSRLATLSAAFQASTIVICVGLSWFSLT